MRYACSMSSSVACSALQYLSALLHKLYDCRKKEGKFMNIKSLCRFSLQNVCLQRGIIKNVLGIHIKYPLFLSDFIET